MAMLFIRKKFELITDHKLLTYLKSMTKPSAQICRWIMQLEEFDFDIIYREGRLNSNADAMSRITVDPTDIAAIQILDLACDLTSEEILDTQLQEPIVNKLRQALDSETGTVKKTNALWPFLNNLEKFFIDEDNIVYHQAFDEHIQIVLPPSLHERVFEMLYEPPAQGHLGTEKTEARFTQHFYWPNIRPKIKLRAVISPRHSHG